MEIDNTLLEDRLKQVAKGAGIFLLGSALGRGLVYLSKVIIGRRLGPDEFGVFNLGFAILMFVSVVTLLGLQEGVPTFISRFRVKGELEKIKGVLFFSAKIVMLSSLVFVILIYMLSSFLSIEIFNDVRLIPVLKIFAITIPFFSLSLLLLSYLRGFKLIKYMVYSRNLFGNISLILLLIIFFTLNYGLYGAILAHLIQYIIILLFAIYFLFKSGYFPSKKLKIIPVSKELIVFSLPLTGSGSLERLRMWIDTLLIGFFLSSSQVGLFNYALIIAIVLVVITASFIVILLPINSELYANNNLKEMSRLYYTVSKWLFFLLFPIFLIMFFFPGTIISVLFGPQYTQIGKILRILSFGYLVNACIGIWPTVIYAIGKTKIDLYLKIVGIVSNISLSSLLIPHFGLIGAAISHTFSLILMDVLGVSLVYRYTRILPFNYKFLKYFIFSIIFFFGYYYVVKTYTDLFSSHILILASFFLYFIANSIIGFKFVGFEKEDRFIIDIIKAKMYI
jgi:O-antigen/teichoic acid export membrane protein